MGVRRFDPATEGQPAEHDGIDWESPLSSSLVFDVEFNQTVGRELVRGFNPANTVGVPTAARAMDATGAQFSSAVLGYGGLNLFTGAKMTIEVIFQPTTTAQTTAIVQKRGTSTTGNSWALWLDTGSGNFYLEIGNSTGTNTDVKYGAALSNLSAAAPQHLLATLDGSLGAGLKIQFYRNGLPIFATPSNDSAISGIFSSTTPIEIGRINNSTLYYSGGISLVRIYNDWFDEARAKRHYERRWSGPLRLQSLARALPTAGGSTYSASASETGSAADAVSTALVAAAAVTESASGADATSNTLTTSAAVAETASATDSQSQGALLVAATSEAVSAADTSSTVAIFAGVAAEAGSASDTESAVAVFVAACSEAGTGADTSSATQATGAVIAESGSAVDSVDWGASSISVNTTESASAADDCNAVVIRTCLTEESASALDVASVVWNGYATLTETSPAIDAATGLLVTPGLAVYPDPATVLAGVGYGPNGSDFTGTLSIPSSDDVASAVRLELSSELLRIVDLAKIHGLVIGSPLTVTTTARRAGGIEQALQNDVDSTVTVTRTA